MTTFQGSQIVGQRRAVMEIDVRNHPGVMSHVVGAFSRRAYNVEGVICAPLGDGEQSRIWLLVNEDERLPQMLKQMAKLVDVIAVRRRGGGHAFLECVQRLFCST